MAELTSFDEVLARDGQLVYTNKGRSMMPLLREGRDLIVIEKKGRERCRKGDAVLFKRPLAKAGAAYVLHRILRVNDDGSYWIVGDNCENGETVREENVLGVLRAVVRGGKTIPVDAPLMRAYVWLWCVCPGPRMFLTRACHAVCRRAKRLRRK